MHLEFEKYDGRIKPDNASHHRKICSVAAPRPDVLVEISTVL